MIIEKFVLSKTAPRNKYVGWIDTSGDEPKIKFNVGGKWSEEYDPEQVQVDWNCVDTKSKAFIKNKPTIPAAQIQSDWTQSDNTALDYIKNKPSNLVDGTNIAHIVKITQAAYDLLESKDATTLYVIISES